MKRCFIFILAALPLFVGCAQTNVSEHKLRTEDIAIQTPRGTVRVSAEVAQTEQEQEQGLMYREKLEEGTGMWFAFSDSVPRKFWMKNTKIPLDIIFLNSKKEIIHIVKNAQPCVTPQCEFFPSVAPAMFALEVPAGFTEANGVENGNTVTETN